MEQPFDGTPFVVTAASQENTGQIQIGRRLLSALKFRGKVFFFMGRQFHGTTQSDGNGLSKFVLILHLILMACDLLAVRAALL